MNKIQKLKKPPIRELVIDIKVKPSNDFDPKSFLEVYEKIKKTYPKSEEQKLFEGKLGLKAGGFDFSNAAQSFNGYLFKSQDGNKIVQFRKDGFALNKLRPYSEWVTEIKKVKQLWPMYVENAKPESIIRIGVRAINDLEFNDPENPERFLKIIPNYPDFQRDFGIQNFLFTSHLDFPESGLGAKISFAYKGQVGEEKIRFILDIDVFSTKILDPDPINSEIWSTLKSLNHLKDDIFFSSLTKKGIEVFK